MKWLTWRDQTIQLDHAVELLGLLHETDRLTEDAMPRPRFQNLPEEKRRRILNAAGQDLAAHGYAGTSLNRILEQAGVSKGAAYYYFDSKDDLIGAVFQDLFERLMVEAKLDLSSLTAESFWSSLADLSRRFLESAAAEPWVLQAAKAIWALPTEARASLELSDAVREIRKWLERLLRRGRDLGVIRSDLPDELLLTMAMAMDEAADRWIAMHWEELGEAGVARLTPKIFSMWQRILAPVEES